FHMNKRPAVIARIDGYGEGRVVREGQVACHRKWTRGPDEEGAAAFDRRRPHGAAAGQRPALLDRHVRRRGDGTVHAQSSPLDDGLSPVALVTLQDEHARTDFHQAPAGSAVVDDAGVDVMPPKGADDDPPITYHHAARAGHRTDGRGSIHTPG